MMLRLETDFIFYFQDEVFMTTHSSRVRAPRRSISMLGMRARTLVERVESSMLFPTDRRSMRMNTGNADDGEQRSGVPSSPAPV